MIQHKYNPKWRQLYPPIQNRINAQGTITILKLYLADMNCDGITKKWTDVVRYNYN